MDDLVERVVKAAATRTAQLLPLLEGWVKTNSYTADIKGVNRMGALLEEAFALDGLSLERRPGNGVGDHLLWTTPAWDQHKSQGVVLVGHHDTVFPPGTFEDWDIEGDRLQGPGVLDMKGGLATIRTVLAGLSDVGRLAEVPLAVISVGDEEIGSPDSRAWMQERVVGASAALVFEAGRAKDRIITQRKGTGSIDMKVQGRAAHAGNHHADGINAIVALSRLVLAACELTDYDRGVTVNVGLISGGSSRNTVAEQARGGIDFRFLTAEDGVRVDRRLRELAAEVADATGTSFELEGGVKRAPLQKDEASSALYREYAACANASGLGGEESPLLGGGSDANTMSAAGVPAIDGLGPRGTGFHTHDENIELSTLAPRVEALARFLAGRLARVPSH